MRLPFSQSVGRNRRGRCRPRYCWSWSRSQSHWAKINTHTHMSPPSLDTDLLKNQSCSPPASWAVSPHTHTTHADQSIYKTVNVDCVHIKSLRENENERKRMYTFHWSIQHATHTVHPQRHTRNDRNREKKRRKEKIYRYIGDFAVQQRNGRLDANDKKSNSFFNWIKGPFYCEWYRDIAKRVKRYLGNRKFMCASCTVRRYSIHFRPLNTDEVFLKWG